jgi:hypothetical protein
MQPLTLCRLAAGATTCRATGQCQQAKQLQACAAVSHSSHILVSSWRHVVEIIAVQLTATVQLNHCGHGSVDAQKHPSRLETHTSRYANCSEACLKAQRHACSTKRPMRALAQACTHPATAEPQPALPSTLPVSYTSRNSRYTDEGHEQPVLPKAPPHPQT